MRRPSGVDESKRVISPGSDRLGAVAGARASPVPDNRPAGGQAGEGLETLGADQPALRRQARDQGGEGGLVRRHGREDVEVIVDQRADQQIVQRIVQELRAAVGRRDDVLVALDQEGRVGPGAPPAGRSSGTAPMN